MKVSIFKEIEAQPKRFFEMIRVDVRKSVGQYLSKMMDLDLIHINMISGKSFYDYWYFSRTNAQFQKLFHLSQNVLGQEYILPDSAQKTITILNKRRISIQKMIGRLNLLLSSVCEECKGICCQGCIDYYFSAIDFWLRKFGSNPIKKYGIRSATPWYYYLSRRLKQLRLHIHSEEARELKNGCDYLGTNGCKLDFADRPIWCLVYTCEKIRQAMDKHTKVQYGRLSRDLYTVCLSTFDILKRQADIPITYGRLSLFLTP